MQTGPLFESTQNDLISAVLQLEQVVLAHSGEDAFEEILKLIVAKLYDEYRQRNSIGVALFTSEGTGEEARRRVDELLEAASIKWPGVFESGTRTKLAADHLKLCVRPLSGVTLFRERLAVLDSAFEHLLTRTAKGSMGQYFTPRHVIDMCVAVLRPSIRDAVLDPACGSGGFLLHAWELARNADKPNPAKHYYGFDIDSKAVRIAHVMSLLGTSGEIQILRLNSLDGREWNIHGTHPLLEDRTVLRTKPQASGWELLEHLQFDFILTNPPFAGRISDPAILSHYTVTNAGNGRSNGRSFDRDVLFIERCLTALRPGGRMAVVLPQGVFCNDNTHSVREWIFEHSRVLGVIGLHSYTFVPHTGAKTSILFMERGTTSEDYPIFFASSEKPGKDSAGQFIYKEKADVASVDHDLDFLALAFRTFLEKPSLKFESKKLAESTEEKSWAWNNISVQRASQVRKSGRLDAEFYSPRLLRVEERLRNGAGHKIRDFTARQVQRFKRQGRSVVAYFDISSVDPDSGFATPGQIIAQDAPSRAQYVVRTGDVLVSTVRPDRNAVTLVRNSNLPMVASSGFCILRPEGVAPEFIFAYCKTEHFRRLVSRYAAASMYPTVTDRDVMEMPFPALDPSLVREVKERVDAAFTKHEEAKKLLREAIRLVENSIS